MTQTTFNKPFYKKSNQNSSSSQSKNKSKNKSKNINKCPICKSTLVTCDFSYMDTYNNQEYERSSYTCNVCDCQFERSKLIRPQPQPL